MAITAGTQLSARSGQPGSQEDTSRLSPFLRLPVEIRLKIYSYLLPTASTYTFEIRTLLPQQVTFYQYERRSKYQVPTITGLYSSSASTTYYLANSPGSGSPSGNKSHSGAQEPLYPQILTSCRTCYIESRPLLYNHRTFSFGKDISAIVPFFSDLLPSTRQMVHSIALTKAALWRSKDFDEAVWRHTCEYLADNGRVEMIRLSVVVAKMPEVGGAVVVTSGLGNGKGMYRAEDFRTLLDVGYEGVEWVRDFLLLSRRWTPQDHPGGGRWYLPGWGQERASNGEGEEEKREGLKELVVEEEAEHCPKINGRSSGGIAFYATFSKSLNGFERFLRGEMLDCVDDWGRKSV